MEPTVSKRKKRLVWARLLWLVSLAILAALIGWIVFQFILPRAGLAFAGSLQDYQVGSAPQLFWYDEIPFYVLRADGELVALSAYSKRTKTCLIGWNAEQGRFVDPCWGTRMLPNGVYEGGGPPWEMVQYPVQIKDDEVWVELGYR